MIGFAFATLQWKLLVDLRKSNSPRLKWKFLWRQKYSHLRIPPTDGITSLVNHVSTNTHKVFISEREYNIFLVIQTSRMNKLANHTSNLVGRHRSLKKTFCGLKTRHIQEVHGFKEPPCLSKKIFYDNSTYQAVNTSNIMAVDDNYRVYKFIIHK